MGESMNKKLVQLIRDDAFTELERMHKYILREDITCLDVRLCYHDGGAYCFQYGDVLYDTHHGIACGASNVLRTDDAEQLAITAHTLVEQVLDQLAEMEA
jgi:hypothetical protein